LLHERRSTAIGSTKPSNVTNPCGPSCERPPIPAISAPFGAEGNSAIHF
jgi:hypothetical protein